MRRVWQTLDGAIFTDQLDAAKHENTLRAKVKMWDKEGFPTDDCSNAMFICLRGEDAVKLFKKMNEECPDSINVTDHEMCDGDEGWWYWDEYGEEYIPFTASMVLAFRTIFADKNSDEVKNCFSF
jgi:hypothetical protein